MGTERTVEREDPDDCEPSNERDLADGLDACREAHHVDRGAAVVPTPLKGRPVKVRSAGGSVLTGWRLEEVQCSREDHGVQLWAVLESLDDPGRTRFVAIRSLEAIHPIN